MGAHARKGSRRAPAARAAIAAVLAAVAGTVLVGLGSGAAAPPTSTSTARTASDDTLARTSLPDLAPVDVAAGVPAAGPARAPQAAPPASSPPASSAPASSRPAPAARTEPTTAAPAPAAAPARIAAAAPALVAGTPCTAAARACVDLVGRQAWLIDNGEVARGPVKIMIGDRDDPTPRGTFTVQWKAEQYTSREYLTQMPYAVFFAAGGIAFHEGRQDTYSAGCVKLVKEDAMAWFSFLQVGDQVQIR